MTGLLRQLRLLRLYAVLTYPFACVPFLYLYFRQHGLDAAQYGEVIGAYYAAMFLCEVPTGMLADRFGPKYALVGGPLLLAAGFCTLAAWHTYAGFLLGEILLGIGHAVLSGPPTTLLYDTLHSVNREHDYLQQEATLGARRLYGTGAAFLLGGLLVQFGNAQGNAFAAAIWVTAGLCASAGLLALGLARAPHRRRTTAAEFCAQLRHNLAQRAVLWLLLYWLLLFALLRFPFHNYQPYLESARDQAPLFGNHLFIGALFAALNLFAAPLSALVPTLVRRCGRVPLFWTMPLLLCSSMLLMAGERQFANSGAAFLPWLGVAMFFVQQLPFGMHQALLYEFVNHRLTPAVRTTVLSALSLATRSSYALLNVWLFAYQQERGIAATYLLVGLAGALGTLLCMVVRPRGVLRGAEQIGNQ